MNSKVRVTLTAQYPNICFADREGRVGRPSKMVDEENTFFKKVNKV